MQSHLRKVQKELDESKAAMQKMQMRLDESDKKVTQAQDQILHLEHAVAGIAEPQSETSSCMESQWSFPINLQTEYQSLEELGIPDIGYNSVIAAERAALAHLTFDVHVLVHTN